MLFLSDHWPIICPDLLIYSEVYLFLFFFDWLTVPCLKFKVRKTRFFDWHETLILNPKEVQSAGLCSLYIPNILQLNLFNSCKWILIFKHKMKKTCPCVSLVKSCRKIICIDGLAAFKAGIQTAVLLLFHFSIK